MKPRKDNPSPSSSRPATAPRESGKRSGLWTPLILLLVLIGVPTAAVLYQSHRTGMSPIAFLKHVWARAGSEEIPGQAALPPQVKGPKIDFLERVAIGDTKQDRPRITNLTIVDLDQDGLKDVCVCDALDDKVTWIRQSPAGVYNEVQLGETLRSPAHVSACDIDKDGDLDLLIAVMGMLFPNNDKIGSVVVLENDGQQKFTPHVLVDKIARVTDVRGEDLDGDGDIDLAVGQFGYDDGEIRWMENKGNWQFESHILLRLAGAIHTPIIDLNADGHPDIVALVSQEYEEIYVFVNDGKGNFKTRMLYGASNEDFGSSGITMVDMDKDGDADILWTNGDAFDYIPPSPRPWHGLQWLENKGDLNFAYHRIGNFSGAYSATAMDVDHDDDLDVFVVSGFHKWDDPESQAIMWFENDGQMGFIGHDLTNSPTHLIVLDVADMNGDGQLDLVTGGVHCYPPYDRIGRVTLWLNQWPQRKILP